MQTTISQAAFLSNTKKRLINLLSGKVIQTGICVKQAEADADALIVATTLSLADCRDIPVVLVHTDTDLVVNLIAQAITSSEVHL